MVFHSSPGHWSVALTWATIWALLTQLSLTVARVPWLAWGIELSHEYHEKTRLVPFNLGKGVWVDGCLVFRCQVELAGRGFKVVPGWL